MSHLHQGYYTDTRQLIAYINGFLWTLEILNDRTDHDQTYYIEEIQRADSYETAIMNHLDNSSYQFTLTKIDNWKTALSQTSGSFFHAGWSRLRRQLSAEGLQQVSMDKALHETLDFELLSKKYLEVMEELISDGSRFFEVKPRGAQHYYKPLYSDFLVDNEKGLFFIHFGESD